MIHHGYVSVYPEEQPDTQQGGGGNPGGGLRLVLKVGDTASEVYSPHHESSSGKKHKHKKKKKKKSSDKEKYKQPEEVGYIHM